jgi:hypothetical protein
MNPASDDRLSYDDLREFEPFDWPGRQLVEQDYTGDWGFWLERFDGWLEDVLQDSAADVVPLASSIAKDYIAELCDAGYLGPDTFADFDGTRDANAGQAAYDAAITNEFAVYLRTWQAAVEAKCERQLLWSPGSPALAIPVKNGETIHYEIWKDRLKKQLRELAKNTKDPVAEMEREWQDRYGRVPSFKNPEDVVDSAEFDDVMRERHNLHPSDFPVKKVRPDPQMWEEVPQDLQLWMMDVVNKIAD